MEIIIQTRDHQSRPPTLTLVLSILSIPFCFFVPTAVSLADEIAAHQVEAVFAEDLVSVKSKNIESASKAQLFSQSDAKALVVELLQMTHISDAIADCDELVSKELENLSANPDAYQADQLDAVKQNMQESISGQQIIDWLASNIANNIDHTKLVELRDLFNDPTIYEMKRLERDTKNTFDPYEFKAYKMKLQTKEPRKDRVEIVDDLDQLARYSRVNSAIRVEIRKNLLKEVTKELRNQEISESLLNGQLEEYGYKVTEEMENRIRASLMYTFRKTPSSKLRQYQSSLKKDEVKQFLDLTETALVGYFRESRRL